MNCGDCVRGLTEKKEVCTTCAGTALLANENTMADATQEDVVETVEEAPVATEEVAA